MKDSKQGRSEHVMKPIKRIQPLLYEDHTIKLSDLNDQTQKKVGLVQDNQSTINTASLQFDLEKTQFKAPKQTSIKQPPLVAQKLPAKLERVQRILNQPSLTQKYSHLLPSVQQDTVLSQEKSRIFKIFVSMQYACHVQLNFRNNLPCFFNQISGIVKSRSKEQIDFRDLIAIMSISQGIYQLSWFKNSKIGKKDIMIKIPSGQSLNTRKSKFRRDLIKYQGTDYKFKLPEKQQKTQKQTVQEKKQQKKIFPQYDVLSFKSSQQFPSFQVYLRMKIKEKQKVRKNQLFKLEQAKKEVTKRFVERCQQLYTIRRVSSIYKVTLLQHMEKQGILQHQLDACMQKFPKYIWQVEVSGTFIIRINKSQYRQVLSSFR